MIAVVVLLFLLPGIRVVPEIRLWVVACSIFKLLNKCHYSATTCCVFSIYQITIGMFEEKPHDWSHLCMLISLYSCTDSSFFFDMQMSWLEEFRSFSVALKLLHYRARIRGMSSSCRFQIQQKSVIRGFWDIPDEPAKEYEWLFCNIVSFPPELRNQGGLWVCSDSPRQKSLSWRCATQAVFIIDFSHCGCKMFLCLLLQLIFVLF